MGEKCHRKCLLDMKSLILVSEEKTYEQSIKAFFVLYCQETKIRQVFLSYLIWYFTVYPHDS